MGYTINAMDRSFVSISRTELAELVAAHKSLQKTPLISMCKGSQAMVRLPLEQMMMISLLTIDSNSIQTVIKEWNIPISVIDHKLQSYLDAKDTQKVIKRFHATTDLDHRFQLLKDACQYNTFSKLITCNKKSTNFIYYRDVFGLGKRILEITNVDGINIMVFFYCSGVANVIRNLFTHYGEMIVKLDIKYPSQSTLCWLIYLKYYTLAKTMIDEHPKHCYPQAIETNGQTAIYWAIKNCNYALAESLLEAFGEKCFVSRKYLRQDTIPDIYLNTVLYYLTRKKAKDHKDLKIVSTMARKYGSSILEIPPEYYYLLLANIFRSEPNIYNDGILHILCNKSIFTFKLTITSLLCALNRLTDDELDDSKIAPLMQIILDESNLSNFKSRSLTTPEIANIKYLEDKVASTRNTELQKVIYRW